MKHKGHIDARQSLDLSALINPANPKKLFKNMKQIGRQGGRGVVGCLARVLTSLSLSGGFADVCVAYDAESQRVVVKRIRLTNLNLKYVLEEVIAHKSSCHANIVTFLDCFFVPEDQELWVALGASSNVLLLLPSSSSSFSAVEYMPNGNLTSRLATQLPEAEMSRVLRAVALALQHIHARSRVHRDIK